MILSYIYSLAQPLVDTCRYITNTFIFGLGSNIVPTLRAMMTPSFISGFFTVYFLVFLGRQIAGAAGSIIGTIGGIAKA